LNRPTFDFDLLMERVRAAFNWDELPPTHRTILQKHISNVLPDIQRNVNNQDVIESRLIDDINRNRPRLLGPNSPSLHEGVTDSNLVMHDIHTNPETLASPYPSRVGAWERIKRPDVLINGSFAFISAYAAINSLMQARHVDEKGQAHYQITPLMLGAVQGFLATLLTIHTVAGLRR
jgi:hypothetical protein